MEKTLFFLIRFYKHHFMSNIYNSPKDFNPGDPEYLRTEAISKDKQREEPMPPLDLPLRGELILFSSVSELLIDQINMFLKKPKEAEDLNDIQIVLTRFKSFLDQLKDLNTSEDYRFAQSLSELWHAIKKHIAELIPLKKKPIYIESLDLLVKKINSYPKNTDHSLGYYLSEYAGEKWLPFPFIDILNTLHEEAIAKKSSGSLHDWTLAITTILSTMNPIPTEK